MDQTTKNSGDGRQLVVGNKLPTESCLLGLDLGLKACTTGALMRPWGGGPCIADGSGK